MKRSAKLRLLYTKKLSTWLYTLTNWIRRTTTVPRKWGSVCITTNHSRWTTVAIAPISSVSCMYPTNSFSGRTRCRTRARTRSITTYRLTIRISSWSAAVSANWIIRIVPTYLTRIAANWTAIGSECLGLLQSGKTPDHWDNYQSG